MFGSTIAMRMPSAFRTSAMLLAVLCSSMAVPAHAQQQPSPRIARKTLRLVPHADMQILDPSFSTAYITRNFGYMVYDTLFALDAEGRPRPQMVDTFTHSADGLHWDFSLRAGLRFSDGAAVTAADVVASLQRWAARDNLGRAMNASGASWQAVDARSFALQLDKPFGLVLEALAKRSNYPPMIFPERLARLPADQPINEVIGSGPFLFKRDEWVPGSKTVFVRNPDYLPRDEPPSGLAGSKKPAFDRVEWVVIPDANTAVSALRRGEVDLIEQVPPDYIPALRDDPAMHVGPAGTSQAYVVLNNLQPPFDNPKAREALAHAIDQDRFIAAMGYPPDMRLRHCATFFVCGSPNDTTAGAEPFEKVDIAAGRRLLKESGYRGEKVLLMDASDVVMLDSMARVVAQAMRAIGIDVELASMSWPSIVARRNRREAPQNGGWNAFVSAAGEPEMNSPIANQYLGAACGNSVPGWPCDPQLDALRDAWLHETDPDKRRERLDAFQRRAFETMPYINAGQYFGAYAGRSELKGLDKLVSGGLAVWALDR